MSLHSSLASSISKLWLPRLLITYEGLLLVRCSQAYGIRSCSSWPELQTQVKLRIR